MLSKGPVRLLWGFPPCFRAKKGHSPANDSDNANFGGVRYPYFFYGNGIFLHKTGINPGPGCCMDDRR